MSDLDLIKQLEKEMGMELQERDFEKITGYMQRGYAIDKNGNNLELNINDETVLISRPYDQKGIFLSENPLEKPPLEIVRKGREAIKDYFESLKKEKAKYTSGN